MDEMWKLRIVNNCLFIDDAESGRVVLQHNARPGLRPYIHPLRGPDGTACFTEDSPGHHPWQHGIETGFHGVNGCEFWEDPGQRPGKAIGSIEASTPRIVHSDHPCWNVDAVWRHTDGGLIFVEQQTWSMRRVEELIYLDLEWRMRAIRSVRIEQMTYGGFFVRMPYREAIGADVINAAGLKDDDCEQKQAEWVDLFMPLERSDVGGGITICDHPSNPAHPAHWRVDSTRGINPSPCLPGPIELSDSDLMRHCYRLLLHSGPLAPAEIHRHWEAYAAEVIPDEGS